jgi:dihydrofolate reductase
MTIPSKSVDDPAIVLIAAMTPTRVIGRANQLPWSLPADLKRFKALTMGSTIVMGRKTFESIGRPLPGRTNVVVSRGLHPPAGIQVARELREALSHTFATPGLPTFVIGGGELYAQAMASFTHRIARLHLTIVHVAIEGDAWFPNWDQSRWQCVSRETLQSEAVPPVQFEYQDWIPRSPT